MKNKLWILALTLMLIAAGTAQSVQSFPRRLRIRSLRRTLLSKSTTSVFRRPTLTVPVGTTVRWTNADDIPHTIVSDDKMFKSKALDTDEQFTYTFTKPGTYGYFCGLHPKMTAKIVVQ